MRELRIAGVVIAGEMTLDGMPGEDLRFGVRPALEPLASIMDAALGAISPTEMRTIENRWLGASARRNRTPATGPLTFSDAEQAWLADRNRQLTICVDPDWLPLEGLSENDKHLGISADIFALFANRSNITFTPLPVDSWSESIKAVKNRHCDICLL